MKRNVAVEDADLQKIKVLIEMNHENPAAFPKLFTSNADVIEELIRVYEGVKGPIQIQHVKNLDGGLAKIKIINAEGL